MTRLTEALRDPSNSRRLTAWLEGLADVDGSRSTRAEVDGPRSTRAEVAESPCGDDAEGDRAGPVRAEAPRAPRDREARTTDRPGAESATAAKQRRKGHSHAQRK